MDTKTLLILAGVGGVAYYLYTESEKKKPVELSQKSKDMRVAKAASQAAIAAGTYKGSARMQRLKAQRAAAQAKKTATFTPSAASPPSAPAPLPVTPAQCPEGYVPADTLTPQIPKHHSRHYKYVSRHAEGLPRLQCAADSSVFDSPEEEAAYLAQEAQGAAQQEQVEQQIEEAMVLLTEAVGRGDLRAALEVTRTINAQMGAPEKTYEETFEAAVVGADDPQAAAMLAHVCAQTQDPKQTYCRFMTLMNQVAQMAKAEVAKKNSGLALAAIGLPVLGLFLVMPLAVVPWVVKQFKPEWSYGKRVATGFVVSFGLGAVTKIAKAASGEDEPKEAAAVT